MKIRIQRSKINGVPSAVVYTTDWSRQDLDAILSVGEPSVDIGGKFWKCRRCEDSNDSNDSHDGCPEMPRGFFESLSPTCPEPEDSAESYEDTDEYFVIPSLCKKIRSGFPVLMDFSLDYFKDPEFCAKIWADEMARRIACKVRMLRFMGTTLAGKEEVYDV